MNQDTYDKNRNLVERINSLGQKVYVYDDLPDGIVSIDGVIMPVAEAERRVDIEERNRRAVKLTPMKMHRYSERNERRLAKRGKAAL